MQVWMRNIMLFWACWVGEGEYLAPFFAWALDFCVLKSGQGLADSIVIRGEEDAYECINLHPSVNLLLFFLYGIITPNSMIHVNRIAYIKSSFQEQTFCTIYIRVQFSFCFSCKSLFKFGN